MIARKCAKPILTRIVTLEIKSYYTSMNACELYVIHEQAKKNTTWCVAVQRQMMYNVSSCVYKTIITFSNHVK